MYNNLTEAPGSAILRVETNIDIDYIYLSFNRESGCPIMVFHVPDVYETEASLKSKGYTVL